MGSVSSNLKLAMEITNQKQQYDQSAKLILSHTILLAWILKSCVSEFSDYSVSFIQRHCIDGAPVIGTEAVDQDVPDADTQIEGLNTESTSVNESRRTFDIKFSAHVPDGRNPIDLLVNIEFQKQTSDIGYPLEKRGIYYCCRIISKQYGTVFIKSDYGKLRKVYSIWICPNLRDDENDSIVRYRLAPDIMLGDPVIHKKDYDLMCMIVISLSNDYQRSSSKLVQLLGTIFMPDLELDEKEKILEEVFQIPMTYEIKGGLTDMCNLSEGLIAYGEGKGEVKGEIKGVIKLYQDELHLKPLEIVSKIITRFNLKPEEAKKYVADTLKIHLS